MARFYDAVDSAELSRIEAMLNNYGIEYTLESGKDSSVSEILVAEEDLAFAESLLSSTGESGRHRAGMAAH